MPGVELAAAYISLVPSAKGFRSAVEREVGGDLANIGQAQGQRLGDGMTKGLAGKAKTMFAPLASAAAAAGVLKFGADSVAAFKESETASNKLADAFTRFPALANSNVASFEKLAEARAKVTRFDDDATKSGQAVLAQFKLTGTQVEQLTPLMQDYAAKTGKDLPTAADDLGKAMLGKGRALAEIGVKFKDTGDLAGNFEQVMGGLRSQVGGFAEKEGATAAGKSEILKNQFGELQELVGSKLVPALVKLTDFGIKVVTFLSTMSPTTAKAIGIVAALAAGIFVVVKATQAFTAAQAAFNVIMALNPVVLIVLAIVAFIAVLVLAYNKVDWFKNFVDGAFKLILGAVKAVVGWVTDNWPLLLAILTGPIGLAVLAIVKNWDTIKAGFTAVKDWIGDRIGDIVGFITGIPGRIAAVTSTMWDGIKTAFTAVKDWVGDRIGDYVGFITGIRDKIASVASGIFDPIKDAFKGVINAVIGAWNSLDLAIHLEVPWWVGGVFAGKKFDVDDVFPDVPSFDGGGTVPGPMGSPQLILAHGGEQVFTPAQAAGGGGTTINVTATTRRDEETAREVAMRVRNATWLAAR